MCALFEMTKFFKYVPQDVSKTVISSMQCQCFLNGRMKYMSVILSLFCNALQY